MAICACGEEELKQQYLHNIESLGEKVRELMESMTEVKETLESAVTTERQDNAELVRLSPLTDII